VYGPTEYAGEYINVIVTNGVKAGSVSQEIDGTISKFAIVKVDPTVVAGSITPSGIVQAIYCPLAEPTQLQL